MDEQRKREIEKIISNTARTDDLARKVSKVLYNPKQEYYQAMHNLQTGRVPKQVRAEAEHYLSPIQTAKLDAAALIGYKSAESVQREIELKHTIGSMIVVANGDPGIRHETQYKHDVHQLVNIAKQVDDPQIKQQVQQLQRTLVIAEAVDTLTAAAKQERDPNKANAYMRAAQQMSDALVWTQTGSASHEQLVSVEQAARKLITYAHKPARASTVQTARIDDIVSQLERTIPTLNNTPTEHTVVINTDITNKAQTLARTLNQHLQKMANETQDNEEKAAYLILARETKRIGDTLPLEQQQWQVWQQIKELTKNPNMQEDEIAAAERALREYEEQQRERARAVELQRLEEERLAAEAGLTTSAFWGEKMGAYAASAISAGAKAKDIYKAASGVSSSGLAGLIAVERITHHTVLDRNKLSLKQAIDEEVQHAVDNLGGLLKAQLLLDMPVLAGAQQFTPDIQALLDTVHSHVDWKAEDVKEYLELVAKDHPDVIKELERLIRLNMPHYLKTNKQAQAWITHYVTTELENKGFNVKLQRKTIEREVKQRLLSGALTVKNFVINATQVIETLNKIAYSDKATDRISIIYTQLALPFLRITSRAVINIAHKLTDHVNWLNKFANNKYMLQVAGVLTNITRTVNGFILRYGASIRKVTRFTGILLNAQQPTDIIKAYTQPLIRRLKRQVLQAVGHAVMAVVKFIARLVVKAVAGVASAIAGPALIIVLPLLIIMMLFVLPGNINVIIPIEHLYTMENNQALVALQNMMFSSVGGYSDVVAGAYAAYGGGTTEEQTEFYSLVQQVQSDLVDLVTVKRDMYPVKELLGSEQLYYNVKELWAVPVDSATHNVIQRIISEVTCNLVTSITASGVNTSWEKTVVSSTVEYVEWSGEIPEPTLVTCVQTGTFTEITYGGYGGSWTNARKVRLVQRPFQAYINGKQTIYGFGPTDKVYYATIGNKPTTGYIVLHTSALDPWVLQHMETIAPKGTSTTNVYGMVVDQIRAEMSKGAASILNTIGANDVMFVKPRTPPLLTPDLPTVGEMVDYYKRYEVDDAWTRLAKQLTDGHKVRVCNYSTSALDKYLCVNTTTVSYLTIDVTDFGGAKWNMNIPTVTTASIPDTSTITFGGGLNADHVTVEIQTASGETIMSLSFNTKMVQMDALPTATRTQTVVTIPLSPYDRTSTMFEIYVSSGNASWSHLIAMDVPVFYDADLIKPEITPTITPQAPGPIQNPGEPIHSLYRPPKMNPLDDSLVFMYWKAIERPLH